MDILTAAGLWLAAHIRATGCIWLFWNLLVMALYGADKRRAVRGRWRIPEKTLLLAAVLLALTNWVKPTKKLHPIVFIGFSAVVGVVFRFAGV